MLHCSAFTSLLTIHLYVCKYVHSNVITIKMILYKAKQIMNKKSSGTRSLSSSHRHIDQIRSATNFRINLRRLNKSDTIRLKKSPAKFNSIQFPTYDIIFRDKRCGLCQIFLYRQSDKIHFVPILHV